MADYKSQKNNMTFDVAISKFLLWGGEQYQDRTIKLYVDHLHRFSKFIKNKLVEDVKLLDDVIGYKRYLKDRGIADTTINMSMTSLRQLWKALTAIEHELGIRMPFSWSAIPLKKGTMSVSHKPITSENFQKLITAMHAKNSFILARDVSMFRLFYDCGMRASELTSLNIPQINIADCSLTIITRKRQDNVKYRQLFFTRETAKAVATYLDLREMYPTNDTLFINFKCGRLTVRSIERNLKKYCTQAGIDPKNHRPHGFRHGWGMRAAKARMYHPYLQQALGHSNLNSSKVYLNIQNEDLRNEYHLKMGDNMNLQPMGKDDIVPKWEKQQEKLNAIVKLYENA